MKDLFEILLLTIGAINLGRFVFAQLAKLFWLMYDTKPRVITDAQQAAIVTRFRVELARGGYRVQPIVLAELIRVIEEELK